MDNQRDPKEYLTAAETAKVVRAALKREFPGVKFYVTSDTYSMGASIDVCWMDGPTEKMVEAATHQFEGSGFDGSIDLKYYRNHWLLPDGSTVIAYSPGTSGSRGLVDPISTDKPHPDARLVSFGADYVHCKRAFSKELVEQVGQRMHQETGWDIPQIRDHGWWAGGKERGGAYEFADGEYEHMDEVQEYNRKLWATNAYQKPAEKPANPTPSKDNGRNGDQGAGTPSGAKVVADRDWLWVYFDSKPSEDIRATLKEWGARWSSKRGGWYFTENNPDLQETVEGYVSGCVTQPALIPLPDSTPEPDPEPVGPVPSPATAKKLRALADKMASQIEAKRNSRTSQQNYTHRRAAMAASLMAQADELERLQYALYALADGHESGDVSPLLVGITDRATVDTLLLRNEWPTSKWTEDERKRLTRSGITSATIADAHVALVAMANPPDRSAERQRQELERKARSLVGQIPGFFPTPTSIAEEMVRQAGISTGMRVLEPSAGSGSIADVIRGQCPGADLSVIEYNLTLQDLLKAKGHNLVGDDFFSVDGQQWDRIVQNPPFENLQDVDHVRWAFDHLADGGRLVSVMSESPFFRSDKKAADFRDWLYDQAHDIVDLEAGAFAASGTGIKARIVIIDK